MDLYLVHGGLLAASSFLPLNSPDPSSRASVPRSYTWPTLIYMIEKYRNTSSFDFSIALIFLIPTSKPDTDICLTYVFTLPHPRKAIRIAIGHVCTTTDSSLNFLFFILLLLIFPLLDCIRHTEGSSLFSLCPYLLQSTPPSNSPIVLKYVCMQTSDCPSHQPKFTARYLSSAKVMPAR